MSKNSREKDGAESFECPHCGARVPGGALSCPECGSDDKTGWAEDAEASAADVPTGYAQDDEFDYDEVMDRELSDKNDRILGLPSGVFFLLLFGTVVVALIVLMWFES